MSNASIIAQEFLRELEAEAPATRKCLEQVPMDKPGYKPHAKSMELGYLALLVADIPRWIHIIIDKGEIDFATYDQAKASSPDDLAAQFDKTMGMARDSLRRFTEEMHGEPFLLKNGGQVALLNHKAGEREPVDQSYGPSPRSIDRLSAA